MTRAYPRAMRSRPLTVLVVVGGALVLPASASAVTATTNQECYHRVPGKGSQPVAVTLAGGTPNAPFAVLGTLPGQAPGGAGSATGAFDAAGNAVAEIANISPGTMTPSPGRKVSLTVRQSGGPDEPVGDIRVTTLALTVAANPRNPRSRRLVKVSGTPFAGRRLYGFVVKPGSPKVLRRVFLGRANACGYASGRVVVAPRSFRAGGAFVLYVNAGPRLNKPRAFPYGFKITRF